jgi:hypothetical protein
VYALLQANATLLCTAVDIECEQPAQPLVAGVPPPPPVLSKQLATAAVKGYARMQGLSGSAVLPFAAVITKAEKDKVEREWSAFLETRVWHTLDNHDDLLVTVWHGQHVMSPKDGSQ